MLWFLLQALNTALDFTTKEMTRLRILLLQGKVSYRKVTTSLCYYTTPVFVLLTDLLNKGRAMMAAYINYKVWLLSLTVSDTIKCHI